MSVSNSEILAAAPTRRLWCFAFAFLVVTLVPLVSADKAYALNYYVDASCANDGNGRADQCASSPGGAGAWNGTVSFSNGGVQNCFNTLVAGDTCFIKNGTYRTTYSGPNIDHRVGGGFHPMNSGTATAKITYRAYPGHRPVLINCTDGTQRECGHQTISANHQSYITYDGLTVVGSMYLLNDKGGPMGRGLEIKNCDISVGWFGDGNWSGVYLEWWDGVWIHHNRIHDIVPAADVQFPSGTGVKLYTAINSVIEYNTFETMPVRGTGIDDKYDSQNQTHRFNLFRNIAGPGIRFNSYSPANLSGPGSGRIYGNVFTSLDNALGLGRNIDGLDIYNNTIYNVGEVFYNAADTDAARRLRIWNNITNVLNNRGDSGGHSHSSIYGPTAPSMSDFNVWQPGIGFGWANTFYNSLSDLQSRRNIDRGSQATTCGFVNANGGDFHLSGSSACTSSGRVGGVSSGAVVEGGAYGVTACVGHTCGGAAPPTTPGAPTNVRITSGL